MTAEVLIFLVGECTEKTWNDVTGRLESRTKSVTPEILMFCLERGRHSLTNCSEIKDADEPESKIAMASIVEPSEDSTSMRQVMSNMLGLIPAVACEDTIGALF